ncbi:hypothetical protein NXS08_00280 [Gleimia sp. 6138-11-ORH1]|uniref:hypothetical protein n=1 Tax=Gleimia sp. 6138-11-ORH1 TaxID=2973937 RepID=UPI002167A692|nr:hypothetical protein [Gleimia sp. 6138-11-ORH1]MCS4483931.1 hypothetical protein [Gleimia sp. 6138-11-ORH1]
MKATEKLRATEKDPNLDTKALSKLNSIYEQYIASVTQLVELEFNGEAFTTDLEIVKNFPKVSDTRPHLGTHPAANPDKRFNVTGSDAELQKYLPKKVCAYELADNMKPETKYPTYRYFLPTSRNSISIQQVDSPFTEESQVAKIKDRGYAVSYKGYGNALCTNSEGADECYEQTKDGRYWKARFNGNANNACADFALTEWLEKLPKPKGTNKSGGKLSPQSATLAWLFQYPLLQKPSA